MNGEGEKEAEKDGGYIAYKELSPCVLGRTGTTIGILPGGSGHLNDGLDVIVRGLGRGARRLGMCGGWARKKRLLKDSPVRRLSVMHEGNTPCALDPYIGQCSD